MWTNMERRLSFNGRCNCTLGGMQMKWIAYCTKCKKDLTEGGWENGGFVEAAGVVHRIDNPDHEVIIGFILKRKEEKDEDRKR